MAATGYDDSRRGILRARGADTQCAYNSGSVCWSFGLSQNLRHVKLVDGPIDLLGHVDVPLGRCVAAEPHETLQTMPAASSDGAVKTGNRRDADTTKRAANATLIHPKHRISLGGMNLTYGHQ